MDRTDEDMYASTQGGQVDCAAWEQYVAGKPKSKYAFLQREGSPSWVVPGLRAWRNMEIWSAVASMWDEFPKLIEAGKPVPLDPIGPQADFRWRDPATHQEDVEHWPATFIFRTRTGGVGIVQVLEPDKMKECRFRFRVIEPQPKGFVPSKSLPLPTAGEFSPAHTIRLVASDSEDGACAMDLDTGKIFASPDPDRMDFKHKAITTTNPTEFDRLLREQEKEDDNRQNWINHWMDEVHADAVTWQKPGTQIGGLSFRGVAIDFLSTSAFDTISPAMVKLALSHFPPSHRGREATENQSTVIFRTDRGTCGMLQVVSISKEPSVMTLQYKIILPYAVGK